MLAALALVLVPMSSASDPRSAELALEDVPQQEIDAAIDRGAAFLAQVFTAEPGKRGKQRKAPKERIGLRALCLYTLLKSGVPRTDAAVQRLVREIGAEPIDQTYDATCALLAFAAHDPIAHRPQIEALAKLLVSWQEKDGAFGYPGFIVDLSNTQYAALGLWAAAQAGVRIEPAVWKRLAESLFAYRDSSGGFGYTPGGEGGTGSMTAAGVGTLALCEIHLRLANELDPALAERCASARRDGLAWLDEHFAIDTNPRSGAWLYYYLYGLERMGGLTGVREIGAHDWYQEGARYLVDQQDEDGGWVDGTDLSDTCFALLFLKRATAADAGPRRPLTGGGKRLEPAEAETESAPFTLEVQGDGPLRIGIESFAPAAVAALERDGERGLGPCIARVEYFVGDTRIGVVLGDAERPARNARFALQWVPDRTGEVELTARVFARPPAGGALVELASAPKRVNVARALPAWLVTSAPMPGVNLAPSFRASASASSTHAKDELLDELEFEPDFAADGLLGTAWLAQPDDEKRALKLSYRKSEDVDVVRVWPATWPAAGGAHFAQPIEVELAINGGDALSVKLSAGEPAVFALAKPTRIKRLDVRLIAVEPGAHPAAGIAEVELFARPK